MTSLIQPTNILLLGAGELGLALLSNIAALPETHITLGIRSPAKYPHLISSTTSLLELDLSSPSSTLIPVFSAYDTIISATGYSSSPASVLKLTHEILSAGRHRQSLGKEPLWYFPWQWGVDYDVAGDVEGLMPLFGAQKQVRDLLRTEAEGVGVQWTIVSTGVFMSFLFEPFWGVVDRSEEDRGHVMVRCLRDWDHGITVTDVNDIGRVLSNILRGDVDTGNAVLYVAGDTLKYRELADIVERVSERDVVREAWSGERLRDDLQQDPEDGVKKYRVAFAGDGVCWEKAKTVNEKLDMDMMSVESYTKNLFALKEK